VNEVGAVVEPVDGSRSASPAGTWSRARSSPPPYSGAGTGGDSQGLAQQFLAVVSTIVEQVVKGRASVLEVAGTGIGERLPDRVVVADLAERLVGGRHGDLAALGRGGLRREDRLSEIAAGRAGDELQPVAVVVDAPARSQIVSGTSIVSSVVGARTRTGKHRERIGAMSFDGCRVAITTVCVMVMVLFHHTSERLLEVLADGFGVVQQDRFVLARHWRVRRRLLQHRVYHVAFRHPASTL